MQDGESAAKRPRKGGAKRPVAKTTRVTLHLGVTTAERLGVHATLSHRDRSRVADAVLRSWLGRYGQGREIFPAEQAEDGEPPEPG